MPIKGIVHYTMVGVSYDFTNNYVLIGIRIFYLKSKVVYFKIQVSIL